MHLNITYSSDILPALPGCAKIFSQISGDQYLAGFWEGSIAVDLAWYIEIRANANKPDVSDPGAIERRAMYSMPKPRSASWTAPSWSWASVGNICSHLWFLAGEVVLTELEEDCASQIPRVK
jgi:hypothetical protein